MADKELVYKIKILGTDREVSTIEKLKSELKSINDSLSKADIGSAAFDKLEQQSQQLNSELFALRKEQEATQKGWNAWQFPEGSYRNMQAQVAGLTEKLRQAAPGVNITAEAYANLEKKVIDGKKALADFDRKLTPSGTLVGEYARGIKQAFEELGVGGVFEKIQSGITESTGAVKGSIGAIEAELNELKTIQKNFTEEGSKEFGLLNSRMEELSGAARAYKQDLKDAAKLNEGFDQTVAGVARVGVAFKSAFDAFNLGSESTNENIAEVAKNIALLQAVSEIAEQKKQVEILGTLAVEKARLLSTKLQTAAESESIVVRNGAIAAQRVLNAVTAAGPWGAIAIAVGALIAAYGTYKLIVGSTADADRKRNAELKIRADLEKKAAQEASAGVAQLTKYKTALTDATLPMEERKRVLAEYNQVADEGNKLSEKDLNNINKVNGAIDAQIGLLVKRATVKAAENVLSENIQAQLEAQAELTQMYEKNSEKFDAFLQSYQVGLNEIIAGDVPLEALKQLSENLGSDFFDTAKKIKQANEDIATSTNQLQESIRKAGGIDRGKTAISKDSISADIDAEIQAREKSTKILMDLLKKQIEEKLSEIKNGRVREIEQEKASNDELKAEIIKQLNEVDGLIDANRKKRAEIEKNNKLPEAERNKAVKRLDEEYFGLLDDRAKAGQTSNEILVTAEENFRIRLAAINKKYDDIERSDAVKKLKEKEQQIDDLLSFELSKENENRAKKLQTEEKFSHDVYELRKKALKDKIDLLNAEQLRLSGATSDLSDNLHIQTEEEIKQSEQIRQDKQKLNEELALLDEARTKQVKEESEKRNAIFSQEGKRQVALAITILSGISSIGGDIDKLIQQVTQNQISGFDEQISTSEKSIQNLEDKISQSSGRQRKLYEIQLRAETEQLKKAEKEKEEVRLKGAKAHKAVAIIQAGIATALAVLNGLNTEPFIPLGLAAAVIAGAAGAIQIAAIADAPLAKGGNLNGGDVNNVEGGTIPSGAGMIQGPSHAGGGVRFIYNGRRYEAEGGELKTHNGKDKYIFTKKVADDPVLRNIALATHNSSGHPLARTIGSLVNMYAGGRSFGGGGNGFLAAGGSIDNIMGAPLNPPIIVTTSTDPNIVALIKDVNEGVSQVKKYVDATNARIDNLKIAVPVDQVTDVQNKQAEVKATGLF